MQTLVVIF